MQVGFTLYKINYYLLLLLFVVVTWIFIGKIEAIGFGDWVTGIHITQGGRGWPTGLVFLEVLEYSDAHSDLSTPSIRISYNTSPCYA